MQPEIEIFLLQEWMAISQAPISFIASMVASTALVWLVMRWAYGVRIANLRSALQAKEERIALLEARIRETRGAFKAARHEVERLQWTLSAVPVVDVNLRDAIDCSVVNTIEVMAKLKDAEERLEAEASMNARIVAGGLPSAYRGQIDLSMPSTQEPD
jgi:hypothetical protein